jgi:hypothetical protein
MEMEFIEIGDAVFVNPQSAVMLKEVNGLQRTNKGLKVGLAILASVLVGGILYFVYRWAKTTDQKDT